MHIDEMDRKLLRALQDNSRRSVQELGELAGLSPSACHRRVKILEDEGIIEGYTARLNAASLGYAMLFYIEVSLSSQSEASLEAFENAVRNEAEILECHLMAGQADYILRVACRDHEDFERLHRRVIARLPGIARVQSNMSIRTVKGRAGLPV